MNLYKILGSSAVLALTTSALVAATISGPLLVKDVITSKVATGTAPLTVASTTEVANLRAATATALATGRTINGVSFDGTANITVTAAAATLTGLGTGVATALGVNVGSAGAPVVNSGALGTPSSGTLTSATGLPISTGVSGLGTGIANALGLAPTGSGVIVLATNAVLTTPTLGDASATSIAVSSGVTGSTLISTVAIGTPPLTVASTTKVTNLNADLLDGLDSTAFQPANLYLTNLSASGSIGSGAFVRANSTTLVTPALGAATATSLVASAGVTGSTLTSTVATGTPPLVVASTTRIPNLNADLIDGLQKVGIQPASQYLTNLASAGTTGSSTFVRSTSPTLVTPTLGDASATTIAVASAASAGSVVSFGSITAGGNITGLNLSGSNTGDQTSVSGNAGTATTLATGRTIGITGDLTWTSPTFNGSGNVTAAGTLASSGVAAGAYGSASYIPTITVDAKGRVTSVTTNAVSGGGGSGATAWVTFDGSNAAVAGFGAGTFVATSQTITLVSHGLTTGDVVWYTSDMGSTIQLGVPYYVTVLTTSTYKLSVSQAARIASTFITADTSGTNYSYHWVAGGTGVVAGSGVDGVCHNPTTATGKYVVGFSSAMADANYVLAGSAKFASAGVPLRPTYGETAITTTNCPVWLYSSSDTLSESSRVSVTFTR